MQRCSDGGLVLGAPNRPCPCVLHRPVRAARALHNGHCGKSCSPRACQVKRGERRTALAGTKCYMRAFAGLAVCVENLKEGVRD